MRKRTNIKYPSRKTLIHVGDYPLDDVERINKTRQEFIYKMIETCPQRLEYLGELNPNDVDFPKTFKKPTGLERTLEYHLFRMVETDTMLVHRWRMYDNNI